MIGGLPGTGKSTLAMALSQQAGLAVIRSDVVRKELAGVGDKECHTSFGQGIYTTEWTKRTYAECLRQSEELLFNGERVLVDANFRQEDQRRLFLNSGRRLGVPTVFLLCETHPEIVRTRLAQRSGDASDADWSIYVNAVETWEAIGPEIRSRTKTINTGDNFELVIRGVLSVLRHENLSDQEGSGGL
jgi:predicted kinase